MTGYNAKQGKKYQAETKRVETSYAEKWYWSQ